MCSPWPPDERQAALWGRAVGCSSCGRRHERCGVRRAIEQSYPTTSNLNFDAGGHHGAPARIAPLTRAAVAACVVLPFSGGSSTLTASISEASRSQDVHGGGNDDLRGSFPDSTPRTESADGPTTRSAEHLVHHDERRVARGTWPCEGGRRPRPHRVGDGAGRDAHRGGHSGEGISATTPTDATGPARSPRVSATEEGVMGRSVGT